MPPTSDQCRYLTDQIARLRELPSARCVPADKLPQSPKLFVYCSTPRPILDSEVAGGSYGRPLYRNNVQKPEGWHSYYNISWDPRVRRGEPLQTHRRREEEECKKIRLKLTQPRKNTSKTMSKDEMRKTRTSDPQVMIRTANVRFARLAIANLRPKEKDVYFVELNEELDQDELCYKGQRIGAAKVLPKGPSSKKNLVDQACQIMPGDFFDFDKEVTPILERLIGAVCYQARLEVLEEAELDALKLEKENFEQQKREEEAEMEKLKGRMKKQIDEQKRQLELVRKQTKDAKLGKYAYSLFAGVNVKYNVKEAMRALGGDWESAERTRHSIQADFNLWVNQEVHKQVTLFKDAQKMLDAIIFDVVSEREAVYSVDTWKDGYEDPVRIFSDNPESSRVPPPTPGSSVYYTSDEEGYGFSGTPNYFATDDL